MKDYDNSTLVAFRKRKVLSIDNLMSLLKCSVATARRRLAEWRTVTSYNQNGRYYVLPGIAKFDENGLWKYDTKLFSKFGNLRRTVIALVEHSRAGLSAIELGELVRLPAYTFLSHFKDELPLHREKMHGLYVYFSAEKEKCQAQKNEREKRYSRDAKMDLPTDAEAVVILVELIKHPHDSLVQLVGRVKRKGVSVPLPRVRNLLLYHGISKKTVR